MLVLHDFQYIVELTGLVWIRSMRRKTGRQLLLLSICGVKNWLYSRIQSVLFSSQVNKIETHHTGIIKIRYKIIKAGTIEYAGGKNTSVSQFNGQRKKATTMSLKKEKNKQN